METQVKKSKKPMILGIISLAVWIIPIVGAIVSTFGIVIAVKGLKEDKCKAYKIALWLNIVGLASAILCFVYTYYLIVKSMM